MHLVQAGNSRTDVGVFAPPSQVFYEPEKARCPHGCSRPNLF